MGKHPQRKGQKRPHGRLHAQNVKMPASKKHNSVRKQSSSDLGSSAQQRQYSPPFSSTDTILLIGEGDFSFAYSLFIHHPSHFRKLCATCFDSRDELLKKHPQAENFITKLSREPEVLRQELAASQASDSKREDSPQSSASDSSSISSSTASLSKSRKSVRGESAETQCSVHYSIDATALHRYRAIRTKKWDRIVFNFPHVGGKSTDVNRQVRCNQALVYSFLQSCIPLLSKPHGTILVTLFEGAPYDLWNIRDLARSAGLQVLRSFEFLSQLYPEYEHARTCGNIHSRRKGTEQVEQGGLSEAGHAIAEKSAGHFASPQNARPGKWRGEERQARTFEFALAPAAGPNLSRGNRKRKRKENDHGSQSDLSDD